MNKVIQPRKFDPQQTLLTAMIIIVVGVYMYMRDLQGPAMPVWNGQTMGTTYTIKLVHSSLTRNALEELKKQVESELENINQYFSTYIPESEVSRVNHAGAGQPVYVSAAFDELIRLSRSISQRSGGAFDPTVAPLVELWGFGPDGKADALPSEEQIREARQAVGVEHLSLPSRRVVEKAIDGVQLNFDAIAKGYAVDRIVDILHAAGLEHVFVEIGGELRIGGLNHHGDKWKIGIDHPGYGAVQGEKLIGTMRVSDLAVATSGDYRNFFEDNEGVIRSHIIDPRTGRPVEHRVASVTVVAERCSVADALATALMVMGPGEGLSLVESYPSAEALFLSREGSAALREVSSSGFAERTGFVSLQPK